MILWLVFWWLRKQYKKHGGWIFYIAGTEQDYPRYMLYTEEEEVRGEMKKLWWRVS